MEEKEKEEKLLQQRYYRCPNRYYRQALQDRHYRPPARYYRPHPRPGPTPPTTDPR